MRKVTQDGGRAWVTTLVSWVAGLGAGFVGWAQNNIKLIALIAVMQGAVIFIRDYPPEIPYKASLHIDNENQEKQTEKQEKDLKAP